MRKLYNEFFYIPKHGKIREKVMLTRVVMTITIMVMYLAAVSITAYAYFSHNITSGISTIKAANFEAEVQIADADGKAVETITTNTSDPKSRSATLEANKTYSVTLRHAECSTSQTGFVIVTATGCNERYHTQQISRNGDGTSKTVTFTLQPTADTVVTFCSRWGTSSNYPDFKGIKDDVDLYIQGDETIVMVVNGVVAPPIKSEAENDTPPASETTPSTSETTTPTATVAAPPETTGTSEPTSTTEPSTTTTEPTATETTSTEATEQPQPENAETPGASATEASE